MRKALSWILPVLLAMVALLLFLSLQEGDFYGPGKPEPPPGSNVEGDDEMFRRLLPREIVHPCPVCGECKHPVEVIENRRVMRLRDHDGWYKIFWAGDDVYFYEDGPAFAGNLRNPTARDPGGTWTIRARPARLAHDCPSLPREISLEFELFTSERPIEGVPAQVPGLPFPLLTAAEWLAYRYERPPLPPVLYFGWRRKSRPRP